MANTYTLISSNVLASSAASVTFSAIPSTYTDLVLRISARSDNATTLDSIIYTVNGLSTSIYSYVYLRGSGTAASSALASASGSGLLAYGADGATATASTFSNSELYVPNYTASQNKQLSWFGVQENNLAAANIAVSGNLTQTTSAISSITLSLNVGPNFVTGSSFYLYGIKSN